ncbi:MAG: NUDIX hydrolase [Alphaproteobacteria bacterium]|nr:NUDIX hydrolase [Alphaproteobacteria bacterium]
MSREYPTRPFSAVGVVVWKDEKMLLIQRGKEPRKGQWSLPGGAHEVGETTREAAAREVLEETNLVVEVTDLLDVVDSISLDDDGRVRMQYVLVDFGAEWKSGEAVAGSDAMDARWVHPDELPSYKLWSETMRIIEKSASLREQG